MVDVTVTVTKAVVVSSMAWRTVTVLYTGTVRTCRGTGKGSIE